MSRVRTRLLISGRVQGVCFRAETCHMARMLGVAGWVRNLPDGRVEAVFEGTDAAVREISQWCRSGPPGALVTAIDQHTETPQQETGTFQVRLT